MKEKIENLIKSALQNLEIEEVVFAVENPSDINNGDYSTNVAMVCAKKIGKNPKELALSVKELIEKNLPEDIEKIEVAGTGFINFYLSKKYFKSILKKIIEEKNEWGRNTLNYNKKILVEHSSPNLFKPFHIGHLMNNTIGESIVRLAKYSGANVTTMTFPSDISLGIAKAVFILLEKIKDGPIDVDNEIVEYGNAYVEGTRRYDEDESIHNRVKEIADNLYSQKPSDEWDMFTKCKAINISYFERITNRLGSKFDSYIYESEAGIVGSEIVEDNTPKVFTKSEGAIVYIPDESRKDINTSVFINSQDNPTYEAKDMGLLSLKFNKYQPDISIFITDNQQISHFEVVLDAAKKINPIWSEKSFHVHHGRMSFKGEKMSSRLGGVPVAEELLNAVGEDITKRSADLENEILDIIAIAAIKFTILRAAAGKDINFDPETSLSFEGDSGPYLQYTTVRSFSLIEKAKEVGLIPSLEKASSEITNLEKILEKFPGVVERSTLDWSPHHVVGYLLFLAQSFNSWYANTKIIDKENPETPYNLSLTQAVAQTLKNGLYLLGIKTPEKM
ncbi:MAG: arginine--tRNA ligase [Candidatus Pacebacteria bacterium]|nr:arginine--tRNA ligase [Candidatus Paceibacterota bacterium]